MFTVFFFYKYTTLGTFFLTCPARTFLKYYEKCTNYGQNFHCFLTNCMVFTETIFSNVTYDQWQCVQTFCVTYYPYWSRTMGSMYRNLLTP